MATVIERKPMQLKSFGGRIYKSALRESMGGVSRSVFSTQVSDFIEDCKGYEELMKDWEDCKRRNYLPERFVVQFLKHIYNGAELKIEIYS